MNHASLFSGIGGAEVAASMMGWQNLFHCEIQEFPRKVLDYWFPNSESYEDITKTDFTKWHGKVDVLTGGFPCQPFSLAGRRKGADDNRYLWPQMLRAIRQIHPTGALVKTLMESRRWWSPAKSLRWDAQTIFSKRITYTERKADSPSTKSVQTSKPKDIPSNRLLFQLVPSEHRTEETESGLLPTVQTQGLKQCNKKGKTEFVPLDLLPTPNAMDIAHKDMEINERGRRNPKKGKTDHSLGLEDLAVAQLLPTPTAMEVKHSNRVKGLKEQGVKGMYSRKNGALRPNGLTDFLDFNNQVGGGTSQLNPLFVEEMMGFPLMWTALPFLSPSGDKNP